MKVRKRILLAMALFVLAFTFNAPPAVNAKGNEYEQIVRHLKTKYRAKKVKIPFMWLARLAVSIVRPAGVKSFSVTIFEDLKFSRETLDEEMQAAMRDSFGAQWSSILRVRSRTGEQVYMYMREAGKNVKISLVTIDKEQAAVIRATINPEKLAEFMDNPKIFGISLDDNGKNEQTDQTENPVKTEESKENTAPEKPDEPKKDN